MFPTLSRALASVPLALLAVAATAAGTAAQSLTAITPSPHSALHVGGVGDTLRVRLVLRRDDGVKVANEAVRLRSPTPALVPLETRATTDAAGEVVFPVWLAGPPGDFALVGLVPGDEVAPLEVPVRVLRRSWFGFLLMGAAGGLALFLYGMRLIGRGLEKAAGAKLRELLGSMTASPFRSLLFGLISTSMVQSSSASTALLVSFASAGLVTVGQCLGALLGAAVGSTLTVQLIAFRISDFALLLVGIGVALGMARGRRRRVGGILLGFGLLFFGLQVMADSMAPLRGMPEVTDFFVGAARNPIPALLVAVVFTGIFQSSAATIGITLSLAFQGILGLPAALPFVLGANVGTATTALLASLDANVDGRRVAWAHAGFRLLGVLVCLPLLDPFADLVAHSSDDPARRIANAYTLLNLGTAILLFPFVSVVERLLVKIVPEPEEAELEFGPRSLDPRFHEQPSLALAAALREVLHMGGIVTSMLDDVKDSLRHDDAELARSIRERDDRVDVLDEAITAYLSDLSTEYLSEAQSRRVLDLLFITKDFELIADIISKALVPGLLRKKREYDLEFSDEGFAQILQFHDGVREALELGVAAVATWDRDLAARVLDKKSDLSRQERRFQIDHLSRLQAGDERARATTTVHVDAMNDLKRIVTHTARIAYAVLGKVHELANEKAEETEGDGDREG